jgi:hypothetical protein
VVLLETCWRTHWEREELDGNSLRTKEEKIPTFVCHHFGPSIKVGTFN